MIKCHKMKQINQYIKDTGLQERKAVGDFFIASLLLSKLDGEFDVYEHSRFDSVVVARRNGLLLLIVLARLIFLRVLALSFFSLV